MSDATMAKLLQDLAGPFVVAMVVGGVLLGWLNNRGRPHHGESGSVDGSNVDDGSHHQSWWSSDSDGGGHHGDGGDGGH